MLTIKICVLLSESTLSAVSVWQSGQTSLVHHVITLLDLCSSAIANHATFLPSSCISLSQREHKSCYITSREKIPVGIQPENILELAADKRLCCLVYELHLHVGV